MLRHISIPPSCGKDLRSLFSRSDQIGSIAYLCLTATLKSRRGPSSTPKSEAPGYTLPPPPNLDIEPREDCKTTVFRFSCRKGLEVTITPLVVTVITSLEGDLADNVRILPYTYYNLISLDHESGTLR
jgi:hypothetical protein